MELLTREAYFGNAIYEYLLFVLALIAGLAAVRIAGRFLAKRIIVWGARREGGYGEALATGLKRYVLPAAFFFTVYLSAHILKLSAPVEKALGFGLAALAVYLGASFLSKLAAVSLSKFSRGSEGSEGAGKWMAGIVKAVIWMVAAILFLDNVGVKINSLVAGLGIGGIAIAFAAQSVLADIFCFFTIFFDKPFAIGDFIAAGEQMGTVEHIGLKNTRLRALGGELLILSNADLTAARVSNFRTLRHRRVVTTLGVAYATAPELLRQIPGAIESVVRAEEGAAFDRAHFSAIGTYSLNYEVVYYVESGDYYQFMDVRQRINLGIMEELSRIGVQLAYPAQRVFVGDGR